MTQQPITIRETPTQRYVRITSGRCDPKTEARIEIIRAREKGTDPLRTDTPGAVVHCRKASPQELEAFDERTNRQPGDHLPPPLTPEDRLIAAVARSRPPRANRTASKLRPASPDTLNVTQRSVWRFIAEHVAARGYSPSVREIRRACGLSSLSVADYAIARLEATGVLRRTPGTARTIVLLLHPNDPAQEAA